MTRLQSLIRKIRHAGPSWTARAILKRGQKRVMGHPALRGYIDRASRVDDEQFLKAIDFGSHAHGDLVARFIDHPEGRHFLDDAQATAAIVQEQFPDCVSKTIEVADAVCRHEFHFLGRAVAFGEEIDWCWIPDTSERWPERHVDDYAAAFYNNADRPGDVKYPWELNRHQFFVTLAKAHVYTGDSKYATALHDQALHWLERNPFRIGINWCSALEISIRLISWTNAITIARSVPKPDAATINLLLHGAYQHARYLEQSLTTHWLVANNHLVGETAGLFAFATTFPEFRESSRWRRKSIAILVSALDQQLFSDGVNHEQATGYHRFVLDFVLLVDRLAELNHVALPERLSAQRAAMLRYESATAPSDGIAPQIGDCDDGRGMLLSEASTVLDYRGWQPYSAVRFDEAPGSSRSEEAVWLLGPKGWHTFEGKEPTATLPKSIAFREGGHYVLRAGRDVEDAYVFVRCGPFGLGGEGSSVHSHADLLSPVIHWRGRPLAIDSGTYGYLCDSSERDAFRGGAVHNTFLPEGTDQGSIQSLWNWNTVPDAQVLEWSVSDDHAKFRGRINSRTGLQHERVLILHQAPLKLVIEDTLSYEGTGPAVWRLHLAPGLDAVEAEPGTLTISNGVDFVVTVRYEGYTGVAIRDTHCSHRYGEVQRNRCIELTSDQNPARGRVTIGDAEPTQSDTEKD